MKKIFLIFLLLSSLMTGIAAGGEIAGVGSKKIAVPDKVQVPSKVTVPAKVKAIDKETVPDTVLVPDVVGLTLDEARSLLEQSWLHQDEDREHSTSGCNPEEHDVVKIQRPEAGTRVARNSYVILGWCH